MQFKKSRALDLCNTLRFLEYSRNGCSCWLSNVLLLMIANYQTDCRKKYIYIYIFLFCSHLWQILTITMMLRSECPSSLLSMRDACWPFLVPWSQNRVTNLSFPSFLCSFFPFPFPFVSGLFGFNNFAKPRFLASLSHLRASVMHVSQLSPTSASVYGVVK